MEAFEVYQLMFLILDELNDEDKKENLINYLTDANPYMREGENSVDVIVYAEFKEKFSSYKNKSDYAYDFICDYLKKLDPYYGDIYSIFASLSKEEYVDTCNNILKNHKEILKKIKK